MVKKEKDSFEQMFYAIKILDKLLGTKFNIDGIENIKDRPTLFVANHFTRVETALLPYIIYKYCKKQTRSLADESLFKGKMGNFLRRAGCIATNDPDRNNIIISDLIRGNYDWIIYPEGSMIKNKKIINQAGNQIFITNDGETRVKTGSAVLALKASLMKYEIQKNHKKSLEELAELNIKNKDEISDKYIQIVPVNITYYPIRPGKNSIHKIANKFIKDLPKNLSEELEIEGNLLLSSDINISFLKPIKVNKYIRSQKHLIYNLPLLQNETKRNLLIKYFKTKLTNKFMYRIYSQTKINFDHLFISSIFYFPKNKISIQHLKNIIYYIGFLIRKDKECRSGESIGNYNLTLLLNSDKHKSFDDITKLAIKSKIIKKEKDYFKINHKKLNQDSDFHNIRLDNTISVIMNEFSIITEANKIVKSISKINSENIRHNIAWQIIGKNLKEYENDYDRFYDKNLSKSRSKAEPIFLDNKNSDTGILLCHGYGASPREVKYLAEFLHDKGFKIYAPRLKGHATAPENIKYVTWQDWYESIISGFNILDNCCEKIIPIGFSTGALLSILLSSKKVNNPKITALIAISAALKLKDIKSILVPGVNIWNDILDKFKIEKGKLEYVVNNSENPKINYKHNYLKGVAELGELMGEVRKNLKKITIPTLVIHADNDPIVDYKSSEIIYDKIISENKNLVKIKANKHVIITNSKFRNEVFSEIDKFLKTII
jgi:esterase/lipase/1-acyl-sn-glycerol-3-phosphate acyltransferase